MKFDKMAAKFKMKSKIEKHWYVLGFKKSKFVIEIVKGSEVWQQCKKNFKKSLRVIERQIF
jgi:hypothetical protein